MEVKLDTVSNGTMNSIQDSMLLGQLWKRLVIGCVDIRYLIGAIVKDSFDFKHYKIKLLTSHVDESYGEYHVKRDGSLMTHYLKYTKMYLERRLTTGTLQHVCLVRVLVIV